MRLACIFFIMILTSGCFPMSATYFKPSGDSGAETTFGCSAIPDNFRYRDKTSEYVVGVNQYRILLHVEALKSDKVSWEKSDFEINVDGKIIKLKAGKWTETYPREPCGGYTDAWGCNVYENYNLYIDNPALEAAKVVVVKPPTPSVNGKPMNISTIKFKRVKGVLFSPLNC